MKTEGQKQSQAHEKRLAKTWGGTTNAASGAFWSRKGDVRTTEELIEHKWTGKLQFTIKSKELKKITREAILDGRRPIFGIHLDGANYVLLLEDDYLEDRHERSECLRNHISGKTVPSATEKTPTSSTRPATRPSTSP